jgi:transcriptional regulator with XRE-family HTH domain
MARGKRAAPTKRGVTKFDVDFGRRMRLLRLKGNISQDSIGKALGLSFQQVQKYEKGTNRASGERITQLALLLNTTPHELMGWGGSAVATVAVDIETIKLVEAFAGLRPKMKPAIRRLVAAIIGDEHGS